MTLLYQGITVIGIPIPSRERWFLAVLAVHVASGLVATIAGTIAMLSRKAAGRHPRAGTLYFWALVVVCVTMSPLVIARWPANNHLALLGLLALSSGFIGKRARREQRPRWPLIHISGMGVSYVFMLTAFYVDNGPHLPGWQRLTPGMFWILPALIGLPLVIYAIQKYQSFGESR